MTQGREGRLTAIRIPTRNVLRLPLLLLSSFLFYGSSDVPRLSRQSVWRAHFRFGGITAEWDERHRRGGARAIVGAAGDERGLVQQSVGRRVESRAVVDLRRQDQEPNQSGRDSDRAGEDERFLERLRRGGVVFRLGMIIGQGDKRLDLAIGIVEPPTQIGVGFRVGTGRGEVAGIGVNGARTARTSARFV